MKSKRRKAKIGEMSTKNKIIQLKLAVKRKNNSAIIGIGIFSF